MLIPENNDGLYGDLYNGESDQINIEINTVDLMEGDYSASIIISSNGSSDIVIPIALSVVSDSGMLGDLNGDSSTNVQDIILLVSLTDALDGYYARKYNLISEIGKYLDPFADKIFVLSIFVGYYVVWSVTPSLHTPLMSVTNAISSVIIVGAIIAGLSGDLKNIFDTSNIFGFLAIFLAAINIFGGFLVTQRMLQMYKKKKKNK